jgi:hypothetical protein
MFTLEYAILSHTCEQEEVTYQDTQDSSAKEKAGYTKIRHYCEEAARDGYKFIWIDTFCIDKTGSAELFEAINSRYQWYKHAKACYAYLSDVEPLLFPQFSHRYLKDIEATNPYNSTLFKEFPKDLEATNFHKSRWFTRGLTLQELIAPAKVSSAPEIDHLLEQKQT